MQNFNRIHQKQIMVHCNTLVGLLYTARAIWTNTDEGPKRVIRERMCFLNGWNVIPLNFGSQTLKSWNFGPTNRTLKR